MSREIFRGYYEEVDNMKRDKTPFEILEDMQKLETREEMIEYLRSLPRYDEPDTEET